MSHLAPTLSLALITALAAWSAGCDTPGAGRTFAVDTLGDARDTSSAQDSGQGQSDAGALADTDSTRVDTSAPRADTLAADTLPSGPHAVGVGVVLGEVDSAFANMAYVSARLTRAAAPSDTSGTLYGACRLTAFDPDAPSASSYGLDAGLITITGTTPAVTLTPEDEGVYGTGYSADLPEGQRDLLPGGGAIVTVSAAGGAEIAAFVGTLQAPEPVTIGLPVTGISARLDPTRDLTVTWNRGTGEYVLVSLTPIDASGEPRAGDAIFCLALGDPGSLEISKEALIDLTGPDSPMMALGVTRARTGSGTTASHRVPLTALRSDGGPIRLVVP